MPKKVDKQIHSPPEKYHAMSTQEVLQHLHTSQNGISEENAIKLLQQHGANILPQGKKNSLLHLFFAQFKDFMTIMLICAAVISGVMAYITGDVRELADTGILLFIILLNTFVGFIQQCRADNAIEKLKKLSITKAKVVRGGVDMHMDSTQLVVGDIIYLEEGDIIPADCRVLQAEELSCDESALTGESKAVKKNNTVCDVDSGIFDRHNMVYSSSYVLSGQARAVVTTIGKETEIGKIAGLLTDTKQTRTPLEKTLFILGKIITYFVISIAAIIFIFGMFFKNVSLLGNFMSSVAVAVAAIPEGMPAVVTVIMAMGVQKMSRERAVVRKLHAVETLGSCNVICSDKTGTLTQNKMTIEEVVTNFSKTTSENIYPENHQKLMQCMQICNTVKVRDGKLSGDPTEIAMMQYLQKVQFNEKFTVIASIPFSSERKMMTVTAQTMDGRYSFIKGGADILLAKCTRILDAGKVREINSIDKTIIVHKMQDLARKALRVLGYAYVEYDGVQQEENLIFIGLSGMIDPPKEGVEEAVKCCKEAGIVPIMITGDHKDTAYAIAERLGICQSPQQVLTGEELDKIPQNRLANEIERHTVYARVSPKHKSMIVENFQKNNKIVAMTGDGVNDAPSIKKADIGIAMGITGTDVTKSAADIVIADDNFTTIITAVKEGRRVFSNIKKTIQFFLATNLAEVLAILVVSLIFYKYDFLTSTQLLWINLVTDTLPVLSLSCELMEKNCMKVPPQRTNALFSKKSLISIAFYGIVQGIICIVVFVCCCRYYGNTTAITMTFFVLTFLELFHAFNIRSEEDSCFGKGFFSNKMVFLTVSLGIVLNLLLCVPPLNIAFGLCKLTIIQWIIVFASSFAIVPIAEVYKAIVRGVTTHQKIPKNKKIYFKKKRA